MKKFNQILLAVGLYALAGVASATLITGKIQIGGSGTLDVAPTNTAPGATQLTMEAAGLVNIDQNLLTDDFDTYLNPMDNVTFDTTTITFEPDFSGSIANFWTAGGFSFELVSLTQVVEVNGFINLLGSGWLTGNGFEMTNAQITITGTGTDTLLGITATTVPEPGIALLLGIGLIGFGVTRKLLN